MIQAGSGDGAAAVVILQRPPPRLFAAPVSLPKLTLIKAAKPAQWKWLERSVEKRHGYSIQSERHAPEGA